MAQKVPFSCLVALRCTDERRHVTLGLKAAHIYTKHVRLLSEELCSKGFSELGLSDAARPDEEENTEGAFEKTGFF